MLWELGKCAESAVFQAKRKLSGRDRTFMVGSSQRPLSRLEKEAQWELGRWGGGYRNGQEAADKAIKPDAVLAHCVEMAILHIERYWEENEKSGVQAKYVKMLEECGAIGGGKTGQTHYEPFDMGSLCKYCK